MSFVREGVRSPLRWVAPLIAVLAILIPLAALSPGVVLWVDASYGFDEARAVIDPLAAGALAWVGGRRVAHGWIARLRSASIGPAIPLMRHFGANLVWLVAGWVAGAGTVGAVMSIRGAGGSPLWWWLAADLASLVVSAAVGYVIGMVGRGFWAIPPAVALSSYLVFAFAGTAPPLVRELLPIAIDGISPFVEIVPATAAGSIAWYLGVGIGVIAIAAAMIRNRRSTWILLGGAAAVTALGAALIIATGGFVTRIAAEPTRVCDESGSPTICVAPGFEAALPELESAFAAMNRRSEGTTLVADRLQHRGRGAGTVQDGWRALYMDDLRPDFTEQAVAEYVAEYGGAYACTDGDRTIVHAIVEAWLSGIPSDLTGDGPHPDAVAAWVARTDGQKNTWLREHEEPFLACQVGWSDLE